MHGKSVFLRVESWESEWVLCKVHNMMYIGTMSCSFENYMMYFGVLYMIVYSVHDVL